MAENDFGMGYALGQDSGGGSGGGFWGGDGKPGKEVIIGKLFSWGSEKWYIPAAYICDEGLVVDYCMEAEPAGVKAFIDKWDLLNEDRNRYTKEQQEQIQREHPLNANFYGKVEFFAFANL